MNPDINDNGDAFRTAPLRVESTDPRYQTLCQGFNQRWTSAPKYIQLVTNDAEAISAVENALNDGLRVTIRGGGHCYEDFVENTGGVILDVSSMKGVFETTDKYGNMTYCVESGATNWDMYTTLFRRYGRTVPAGSCYSVGAGGHICGGGYGLLSRRHGLTVDHLAQVDVVTVKDGLVKVTQAHRDDADKDSALLFWAHTGGGGGNFGVILRYYFAATIPKPPAQVWLSSIAWPWAEFENNLDEFHKLLTNYGTFFAEHSGVDDAYQGLFSLLKLTHKSNGNIVLVTQWDGDDVGPLEEFVAAVESNITTTSRSQMFDVAGFFLVNPDKHRQTPWFQATMTLNGSGTNERGKYKSAYHRKPFSDQMIAAMHKWLTKDVPGADMTQTLLQVDSYGCTINAMPSAATAVPQRDSILKLQYQTYWSDPAEDEVHLKYMRDFYQEVYVETGGVPEISDEKHNLCTDGAYVNYPDIDLGIATDQDPLYPKLYYKDAYRKLQLVKSIWDPQNHFHHKQSILPLQTP